MRMEIRPQKYICKVQVYALKWSYDLTDHIMVELDTVIALSNLPYDAETDTYELYPSDENVFNGFITKNP
jgi:hypothetical protein